MRVSLGVGLLLAVCACPKEEAPGTPHPIARPESPVAAPSAAPVTPEPAAPSAPQPPQISRWDRGAIALARDCHARPWEVDEDGGRTPTPDEVAEARDLADRYRCGDDNDYEQNCATDGCWDGRETCRARCRTRCNSCATRCPAKCDECQTRCSGADAGECRLGCGVAAAQCQATCFWEREPCYQACGADYDACGKKAAADWERDCGAGCPDVTDCCAKATGGDHGKACPDSCFAGKVPKQCGDCQWYEQ